MSPEELKRRAATQIIRKKRPAPDPKAPPPPPRQPIVVKSKEGHARGIRSFESARYAVGCVMSGKKHLYMGDTRHTVIEGDLFFLNKGTHYFEDVPAGPKKPYEEIVFFYTAKQAGTVLATLGMDFDVDTHAGHKCAECTGSLHTVEKGWEQIQSFFRYVNSCVAKGYYQDSEALEKLALQSMIHQVVDHAENCLRTRVLGSTDPEKELMERQINQYIFSDISLDEFARLTNRSITSFKKKFKEYFHEPPHRWVNRQRLMYARIKLMQSDYTIARVGAECGFPNTSHFIKLFRSEFGITPATYRKRHAKQA